MGLGQARFVPTPNRKIGCSKHILEPIHQSEPYMTIHYAYNMTDWKGGDDMKWLNQSVQAQFRCGT